MKYRRLFWGRGGPSRFAEDQCESTCRTKACRYARNTPVSQARDLVLAYGSFNHLSRKRVKNWTVQMGHGSFYEGIGLVADLFLASFWASSFCDHSHNFRDYSPFSAIKCLVPVKFVPSPRSFLVPHGYFSPLHEPLL